MEVGDVRADYCSEGVVQEVNQLEHRLWHLDSREAIFHRAPDERVAAKTPLERCTLKDLADGSRTAIDGLTHEVIHAPATATATGSGG